MKFLRIAKAINRIKIFKISNIMIFIEEKTLKYPFDRKVENRRIEMAVLETAEDKGRRKDQIEVAKIGLAKNLPFDLIVELSRLLPSEIQLLAEGKDIDS